MFRMIESFMRFLRKTKWAPFGAHFVIAFLLKGYLSGRCIDFIEKTHILLYDIVDGYIQQVRNGNFMLSKFKMDIALPTFN